MICSLRRSSRLGATLRLSATVLLASVFLLATAAVAHAQGSIAGTVTDPGGAPLPNVNVNVFLDVGTIWSNQGSLNTDSAGGYRFTDLADGTYRLFFFDRSHVHAFEYWDGAFRIEDASDVVVSNGSAVVVDNTMELAGRIAGSLTDPGGRPLEAALVFAFESAATRGNALLVADASDGTYDLGGLPSGDYVIQFTGRQGNRGYASYYDAASDFGDASEIEVTLGQTVSGIDGELGLGPGGTLSGNLSDPYGRAFDAARVEAFLFDGTDWVLANGTDLLYRETAFDLDVEAGTYRLRFTANRYPVPDEPLEEVWNDVDDLASGLDVTVGVDGTVTGLDAVLGDRAELSLSGEVTDGADSGIAGIEVIAYNSRQLPLFDQIAVTDDQGLYQIDGLWPDGYRLQFYDPQGRYQEQFFDGASSLQDATPIVLVTSETGVDATLADADPGGPGSIAGTITLEDGSPGGIPLFGTRATASTLAGDFVASAFSAGNGTYRIRNLPAGDYLVRFSAGDDEGVSEYYDNAPDAASATAVSVAALTATTGIDAALAPAGTITGTVTDPFGGSFSLLTVTAYAFIDEAWNPVKSIGEVNSSTYELSPLPVGTYRVGFSGGSWTGPRQTEFYQGAATLEDADDIVVSAGQTTTDIDAVLGSGPPGAVSGTVTDGTGQPVEGIEVSLFDSELRLERRSAASDAAGAFTVDLLYADTYYVRFTDPTGTLPEEFFDNAPSLDLATPVAVGATEVTGIDATLDGPGPGPGGAAFTGTVTDASTGAPVAGVRVNCHRTDGSSAGSCSTLTDSAGTYLLGGNLPAGNYTVRFQDPDGDFGAQFFDGADFQDQATAVTGVLGQLTPGIDAALDPAGAISGIATDPFGNDFALLSVTAYRFDDGHWKRYASTSELNGSVYELDGLPTGTYRVGFVGRRSFSSLGSVESEFWDNASTVENAADIQVTAGQTTADIDAVLGQAPGGAISGNVTDIGGTPLTGIDVVLYDGEFLFEERRTTTDSNGDYAFEPLFSGVYYIEFSDPTGIQPTEFWNDVSTLELATPISVAGSAINGVDAALDGGASGPGGAAISGRVSDIGGAGLPGIRVSCQLAPEALSSPPCFTTTDANGDYQLGGNLPAGEYLVRFTSADGSYASEYYRDALGPFSATPVTLTLGQVTSGIDEDLLAAGAISGTVTNLNGSPFSVLTASAFFFENGQWRLRDQTIEISQAQYTITGLPTGTYRVAFSGGGFFGPRREEVWDNATSLDTGTDVAVVEGTITTDIDAVLGTLAALHNGGFDATLAPWTMTTDSLATVTHSGDDVASDGGSGSARLEVLAPGSDGARLSQCVAAEAGVRYRLWSTLRLSGSDAQAQARVSFFAGDACDGEGLAALAAGGGSTPGDSTWADTGAPLLHAPIGTTSARIDLILEASDSASAHFDAVAFVPVQALFFDGFEGGADSWERVQSAP